MHPQRVSREHPRPTGLLLGARQTINVKTEDPFLRLSGIGKFHSRRHVRGRSVLSKESSGEVRKVEEMIMQAPKNGYCYLTHEATPSGAECRL
jgi:hypothetical protein